MMRPHPLAELKKCFYDERFQTLFTQEERSGCSALEQDTGTVLPAEEDITAGKVAACQAQQEHTGPTQMPG